MPAETPIDTAFDQLLLRWVTGNGTLSSEEKHRLLSRELRAINADGTLEDWSVERRTKALSTAVAALEEEVDVGKLRSIAELITSTADARVIAQYLDSECTLQLSYDSKTHFIRGRAAVAEELSMQQQSIMDNQSDVVASRSGVGVVVRAVSPVSTWCRLPDRSSGTVDYSVGSSITFYADAEGTAPIIVFHSLFRFSAEGTAIEAMQRVLEVLDVCDGERILQEINFGPFGCTD